jgi:DNA ligase 1
LARSEKREFLLLAHDYEVGMDVSGWLMSIKLDGQRAFWDGGISRGLPTAQVPFANVAKDSRFLEEQVATGLWSRYGKAIHAPDAWLDYLPEFPLDLELWMGNGRHQELRSVVSKQPKERSDAAWMEVRAMVLDAPSLFQVFEDGVVRNTNWEATFVRRKLMDWVKGTGRMLHWKHTTTTLESFSDTLRWLKEEDVENPIVTLLEQAKLPEDRQKAEDEVQRRLVDVVHQGGEGLVLRRGPNAWVPKRSHHVLKVKPEKDAEGTVVGFTWGRKTDKGSRHLGRMGALILELAPGVPAGAPMTKRRLELSGFTDAERAVRSLDAPGEATSDRLHEPERFEGRDASTAWEVIAFPRGSQVTFTYRELTLDGIPKEARFLRPRTPE